MKVINNEHSIYLTRLKFFELHYYCLFPTPKEQCPRLFSPLNGQIDVIESLSGGQIQQGSIATYTCDAEFVPNVRRFRECLNDFTWSGSPTQCISGN